MHNYLFTKKQSLVLVSLFAVLCSKCIALAQEQQPARPDSPPTSSRPADLTRADQVSESPTADQVANEPQGANESLSARLARHADRFRSFCSTEVSDISHDLSAELDNLASGIHRQVQNFELVAVTQAQRLWDAIPGCLDNLANDTATKLDQLHKAAGIKIAHLKQRIAGELHEQNHEIER